MTDDTNRLVIVGDSKNREIHAFDFEGNVVHSIDSRLITTSLAFKPGVFVSLSTVSLTSLSITTTSPITFAATGFNDRSGKPLATDVDFSNFAIKATSDVSSSESDVVLTKTISGTVSRGEGGEITFAVAVPNVGQWTFSLVDVFNDEYEEHIGGSPYTYTVTEGPTNPAACILDFTQSIKAGEEFRVTITTYDFQGNPTEHADDTFLCTLDKDDAVEVARADDGTVEFSKSLPATGAHKLTVVHVPTNTAVAGSPISFEVLGNDFTNTYIAAGVGGVVLLLGYAAYKRYAKKAIVREDEPTVEIGEKLKEMLDSRISSQNLFIVR
ncbi:hypothetical protein TeGR_g6246, partial [Tetraparma gracilis]